MNNPIMEKGLKRLTADRFNFLKKYFDVQIPIVVKNNLFIAEGCKAHECPQINFILIVDLTKDVLYVGIRDDVNVKTFSEDGSPNPEPLKAWLVNGNFK